MNEPSPEPKPSKPKPTLESLLLQSLELWKRCHELGVQGFHRQAVCALVRMPRPRSEFSHTGNDVCAVLVFEGTLVPSRTAFSGYELTPQEEYPSNDCSTAAETAEGAAARLLFSLRFRAGSSADAAIDGERLEKFRALRREMFELTGRDP